MILCNSFTQKRSDLLGENFVKTQRPACRSRRSRRVFASKRGSFTVNHFWNIHSEIFFATFLIHRYVHVKKLAKNLHKLQGYKIHDLVYPLLLNLVLYLSIFRMNFFKFSSQCAGITKKGFRRKSDFQDLRHCFSMR